MTRKIPIEGQMFLLAEAVPELPERELVFDYFCGIGGASTGIEQALGRSPDVAINHSPYAIEAHSLNHPKSRHFRMDIRDVDPVLHLLPGRVRAGWVSSDCTHFSTARGGTPVRKDIRGLSWMALRLAAKRKPDMLFLENVAEFQTWGPVRKVRSGKRKGQLHPVKSKKGQTFRKFVGQFGDLGYRVEWRILNAADYGAPTSRRRLILVARRDGKPIVWPDATHGPGRAKPYRTAGECIDWSIPCPSIFGRSRPLVEATQRRIAEGLRRFVLETDRPYIARSEAGVTADKRDLVVAWLAKHYGGVVGHLPDRPIGTITSVDHHSVVACHLTKFYGSAKDGAPLDAPAPTVTGQGQHIGLVAAFLTKYYGQGTGQSLGESLHTVVSKARFGLVTVTVAGEEYAIVDIGLRMLTPRELARCQGFPDDFQLVGTQTKQIAGIGNSVSPPMARAVVAANI